MVEGSIETREYTDKQEVKRWTTEIVVRGGASIVLPVDMPRAEGNRPHPAEDYRSASRGGGTGSTQPASNPRPDLDDDIPF